MTPALQKALAARGWKEDAQAARCGVWRLCWRPPGAGPGLEAYLCDEVVGYRAEVYWYTGDGAYPQQVFRQEASAFERIREPLQLAAQAETALLRADAVLRLGGRPGLENPG